MVADTDLKTVLLVEDNRDDEELVLRFLQKNNITNEVIVASDGETAVRHLTTGVGSADPLMPDLVFLDIRLPGISGLDVLKKIRENERTKTVPVVVMSGTLSQSDVQTAYAFGANSVVIKPTSAEKFGEIIMNATMYWLLINRTPYSPLGPSDC